MSGIINALQEVIAEDPAVKKTYKPYYDASIALERLILQITKKYENAPHSEPAVFNHRKHQSMVTPDGHIHIHVQNGEAI